MCGFDCADASGARTYPENVQPLRSGCTYRTNDPHILRVLLDNIMYRYAVHVATPCPQRKQRGATQQRNNGTIHSITPFELQPSVSARPNILTRAINNQEHVGDGVCRRLRVPVKDRESEHDHAEDESGGPVVEGLMKRDT
jgi:hypothetical protein